MLIQSFLFWIGSMQLCKSHHHCMMCPVRHSWRDGLHEPRVWNCFLGVTTVLCLTYCESGKLLYKIWTGFWGRSWTSQCSSVMWTQRGVMQSFSSKALIHKNNITLNVSDKTLVWTANMFIKSAHIQNHMNLGIIN